MTVCNMSIEAGARAGHDRARRHDVRVSRRAGRARRRAPRGTRRSPRWRAAADRRGRAPTIATVTLDAADARADDHLRHQPGHGHPDRRARARSRRMADASAAQALDKALRYMGLQPGQPLLGHSRSTWCSSAAAPTRASPTCAPPRACCEGRKVAPRRAHAGRARLAAGQAPGRGRGARPRSSATRAPSGARPAARCASP